MISEENMVNVPYYLVGETVRIYRVHAIIRFLCDENTESSRMVQSCEDQNDAN